ncbi:MAG: DUF1015 domain-containing protein, partial [Clostridia bacterium]|nr:DUF1015 domain-containing protein [Clostridia bacterium]
MNRCYKSADVLLPDFKKYAPEKWAVVACDQFTSEPEYWARVEETVGEAPSTLNIILPEVYLAETETRLDGINARMLDYEKEILQSREDSMIYVERTQSDGTVRHGIVMAVDLEAYDYKKGAKALIRATEATVIERIPPRVAIRRGASIELPHVMLLIDDPEDKVFSVPKAANGEVIYDFELMLGGGHIKGSLISKEDKDRISKALDSLILPEAMLEKYGDDQLAPLLFAVGDGNHSLATAKATYEEIKAKLGDAAADHPARYALIEVVNLHDGALKFEPIYRIMTGVDPEDVISSLTAYINTLDGTADAQSIDYLYGDIKGTLAVEKPIQQLAVGTLQIFIDDYIKSHEGAEVDYIHGEDSIKALTQKPNSIGFVFEGMAKDQLFKTVIFDGALP